MESNTKTITTGALSVILTTLIILGGVSVYDDDTYYCEDNNKVMQCDKLSKYYGLDNGKCWNTEVGNKLCRSGWLEITKEDVIESEEVIIDTGMTNGKQYECNTEGCVEI